MNADAGAIDQELSTDMTGAEISTDSLSNESMTPRKKLLCTGRALDRIANAPHGWGM